MTTLFPTFTSIWQRAKRFLATDTRDIWQRLEESPDHPDRVEVFVVGECLYWNI
jgi:hypothetical protein